MALKVYSAAHPAEAHFICGLLNANNIAAQVRGEYLSSALGILPFGTDTEPGVWIDEDHNLALAQQIIAARSQTNAAEKWQCQKCREWHDANFSACWQCGESREL